MISRSTRSSLRISASWLLSSREARSRLSEPVTAFEVHGEAAAHGGVTEGGGQEGLADTDGAHDHGVVAGLDEAQRAQLVPHLVVIGDLGGVVPAVQGHLRVETGGPGATVGRGGLAAGDLVGEDEFEELGMAHLPVEARMRRSGRVSRQRPSFTRRNNAFSSGVTAGALIGPLPPTPTAKPGSTIACEAGKDGRSGIGVRAIRGGDGEVGGVAGEPAGEHGGGQRRLDRRGFGASFEHPADQPDVDRFGFQRSPAGGVDPFGAPLLDQTKQGVDLAHLGPRQRDVQQRGGVDADRLAVAGGDPLQPVEVTHRVDRRVRGQIGRVGDPTPGSLARMHLDELAAGEDPHQGSVGTDIDATADQVSWHRVERLGHLDVMIPVHLRRHVDRQVIGSGRRRQQPWLLVEVEHLDGSGLGGAMDA